MSNASTASAQGRTASGGRAGRGWWTLARNVYKEMTEDHVGLVAAGVAFYGLLGIFPGLVAVMAIAGLVMDPQTVVAQLDTLARFMPEEAATIITEQAGSVASSEGSGLGLAALFGLLVALYSASKGMTALIEGLNVAFEVEEKRSLVRYYLTAFALTIGLIVGFLLIVAVLAVVPVVTAFVPLGATVDTAITLLRWPVVLVIVGLGLAILYRYAPDRGPVPWHWITPGAGIALGLWLLGSIAFAVYVANFGAYNESFGALGGVIVLLTWLWLSAYIILLGAEIDDEIERQDKQDGPDARPVQAAKAVTPGTQT